MEVKELADWPSFPFCSKRCRTIDLGRWLGEEYRASSPAEEPDGLATPDDEAVP